MLTNYLNRTIFLEHKMMENADCVADLMKLSKNCQFICAFCKASIFQKHNPRQFIKVIRGVRDNKLLERFI